MGNVRDSCRRRTVAAKHGGTHSMSQMGQFVWGIADQLRGVYKPHQYGDVILPMTILRRLDAVMADHRSEIAKVVESTTNDELRDARVKQTTGLTFHNATRWTFASLVADPEGLASNLVDYISGFSSTIDVFERFRFEQEIAQMAESNRLLLVVQAFARVDLHPSKVSNAEMGDLFEELIRKFAEASNETAGEHFTPRDAIRLVVDLLFARDDDGLTEPGAIRSIYDPTVGTGGMLSVAEEHLVGTAEHAGRNPDARLNLFGQEINGQSYAICKSDMIAKGQDARNIRLGDTLADDLFAGQTFDYVLSNPPYGVDWKSSQEAVKRHVQEAGEASRFPGGLPAISDGQMLFLQHVATKMRPLQHGTRQQGGRAGIVLNGSPLFTGAAESGPSEVRRWLLEHDLVDAIVALPTNMFYNTGIATYVWVLDNAKPAERQGTVQLIDGSSFFSKMRKSLGAKSRELTPADRDRVLALYAEHANNEHSKVLPTNAFGFWTITVERPLRDDAGEIVRDRSGKPKADAKLRDTETVPFTYGGNAAGQDAREATIQAYVAAEVTPHVPDAWIDAKKTKVGYEIPFTRHFYRYVPPRPLEEIDRDLDSLVAEIRALLNRVEA
ncbi:MULTISPECIES: N-6 DNA methylase [unclassified Agrococcus]|uniref:type I restriction-modification system subunit M n=1 Tax=unclassified Agrococcus TaxID=2615065 RepID=UPI00360D982D